MREIVRGLHQTRFDKGKRFQYMVLDLPVPDLFPDPQPKPIPNDNIFLDYPLKI